MPRQYPQFNDSAIKEPSPKVQKLDRNGVHGALDPTATLFLKVKKLSEKAVLPSRVSPISAGYDLSSATDIKVPARGKTLVPTDLSIAIPEGTCACIAPRSDLAWKNSIDVGAGVIDADYRGPVGVILFNHSDVDFEVKVGDRIAQLIIQVVMTPDVVEVDDLDSTDRGTVESDLPSGESVFHRGRDYTSEFTTDQIFKGRAEMLDWVRRVGRQNGTAIVIKKSANLKGGKLPKCILGCERGGKYEPSRHLPKGQPLQRNTKTRKCCCPFELRGLPMPPDGVRWGLLVKCGFHNHETTEYFNGHEYSSRLKPVEKQIVFEMAGSTKPREILSVLKERDSLNTTGIQSIYNAIYKHKEVQRSGGK